MPCRISNLDFAASTHLGDFLKLIDKYSARIARFEVEGPAGGNPRVAVDFPARETAEAFLRDDYLQDPGEANLYPITAVTEDAR